MRKALKLISLSLLGKKASRSFIQCISVWTGSLSLWTICFGLPVFAAETIAIEYGSLKIAVAVDELNSFVATGDLAGGLADYASFLAPEQRIRLREVLQKQVDLNATLISQLVYSPVGDIALGRLDRLINAGSEDGSLRGSKLKAAVVQAAAAPEGLTLLSVLKQFPSPEVHVNAEIALELLDAVLKRTQNKQKLITQVETQAAEQSKSEIVADIDWSQLGPLDWHQLSFDWVDAARKSRKGSMLGRTVPTDLYLPKVDGKVPVVVISHGMASNRQTLAYLAEHLASHGVAVAVPEHIGSNGTKFQRYFDGVAAPPEPREVLDRPLDVTFILDQLAELPQDKGSQLLIEQTVVIGQSFGGYTALALGGAELNVAVLKKGCGTGSPQDLLNLSLLLQCQLAELDSSPVKLRDERVVAVMAVNPFTSRVFGRDGVSAVDVPVMMVASSSDFIAPPAEEQLYPFTWLPMGKHYLALIRNGTHFSVLEKPTADEQSLPIAPRLLGVNGEVAQGYLSALSLAFVRRYGVGDETYESYLTPAYGQYVSQAEMSLSIVRSLNLE